MALAVIGSMLVFFPLLLSLMFVLPPLILALPPLTLGLALYVLLRSLDSPASHEVTSNAGRQRGAETGGRVIELDGRRASRNET